MSELRVFSLLARIGLTCYAAVHLIVAWLAVQVALGDNERADKAGALQIVASEGGAWLLWLVAAGTGVLALWQLAEAITGHRHVEPRRRWVRRSVSGVEVVLYGLVAYSAGKTAMGASGKAGSVVASVLSRPWGAVAVIAAGVVVIAVAAWLAYRGARKKFLRDLDFGGASPTVRTSTTRLGQIGWCAVGVLYATVGAMFVLAAVRYDPAKAGGLDPALKTLAVQPYGQALLLTLAAGIAVFGVFALLEARFRRL
ncbi:MULTISPECIES: DUF1206 domain-containing protein [unclassified Amycolatopsis]|uniref:DUF1206 domain-containing protein n=1 Tax=unclassified Amycolatopsis TaxID=2618356 RepID=UPI002874AEAE|nr:MULTISPECIES: DUF1206 domain-containing protein [unclassified Amycolatopsis]MDS0135349.1 DUF1206 domain-containing protein [Amycolatopsis sp. 505]MDS0140960.1 DUF1206 domain-containing protein [Amycolatopsis sp. CM201R]